MRTDGLVRVAIVTEAFLPRVNGVTNSVLNVVRQLTGRGVDHLVIAPNGPECVDPDGIKVNRVRSIELPGIHDVDIAIARSTRLVPILRDFDADVVHLASPFILGSRGVAAARSLGIASVAVFQTDVAGFAHHYGLSRLSFVADALVRRNHQFATINLAPSRASQEYLTRLGVQNVRYWGRGVDLERFHPSWRSEALRLRIGSGRPIIGYVGRLAPEKNVEMLAEIDYKGAAQLLIVGDGPMRSTLQRILPNAHFTGRLDGSSLVQHLASLDVLVAPGERETFCQVIQEAMACHVPVVAPAIGGPADLVDHGRNGLLYEPGDFASMRHLAMTLALDPQRSQPMGLAGRESVSRRDWGALTDELVGHYQDAIELAASRAGQRQLAAA